MDEIQDVQHSLWEVDPDHSALLKASFSHKGLYYILGLISVIAVQPAFQTFDPFDFLDCTEERRMMVHNDCQVEVLDGRHRLNLLRSLR